MEADHMLRCLICELLTAISSQYPSVKECLYASFSNFSHNVYTHNFPYQVFLQTLTFSDV